MLFPVVCCNGLQGLKMDHLKLIIPDILKVTKKVTFEVVYSTDIAGHA